MMVVQGDGDEVGTRRQHMEDLREDELLNLIRDTVEQLNNLGDKLEAHVKRKSPEEREDGPSVG